MCVKRIQKKQVSTHSPEASGCFNTSETPLYDFKSYVSMC